MQHTLKSAIETKGIGLHTGKVTTIKILPADKGYGIKFKRVDLEDQPIIPADVNRVVSTNRGTSLRERDAQVSTVEHVLSALSGARIDNAIIEIDGPECPILDGSALHLIEEIEKVGIEEQDAKRPVFEILEPISFKDELTGSEIIAYPHDGFEITSMIDFDDHVLGKQFASISNMDEYKKEVAPARTFVFLHELQYLVKQNLIKGGDLDNAIVIVDRLISDEELSELASKLGKEKMEIKEEGVLNNTELRFSNEPAKHKLLDLIGDLALLGVPIKGKIVATKPGHHTNVEFTKLLKKAWMKQRKLKGIPRYNPSEDPVLDVNDIQKMLPHRYPFLLVDKVIELTDNFVVGIKNVTANEHHFLGHFPNNPVMPGVLQMEALAQAGGILALSKVPDPHNWDTYFIKMDRVKFKRKVMPGDTLILKMELLQPIRRGIVAMYGTVYVGDKIVSEGELTAQILNRTL